MTVRNVKKNLAGQQDLLPGLGPYEQIRRGQTVTVDGPAKSYFDLFVRSYAEVGLPVKGTFEDGCTLVTADDIAIYLADGKGYSWGGALPKVVTPRTTPSSYGGVGAWVDRTDVTLRSDLADAGGAGLVGPGVIARGADKFSILQGRSGEQFGADITRGLGVQLAEPITGSGLTVNTAKFNYIRIEDDRFNSVDDLVPGTKVDGLLLNHKFGGPGTKGGRHAAEFILEQTGLTDQTNTDRNYVGCVGFATSSTGDGGTNFPTAKGAYFGGNFYGTLTPGAMFALNVSGAEFNAGISDGASANIRTGIQIGGTKSKRGDIIDAGISIGNMGSAVTWRTGIAFGPQNGGAVFGEDSRVISVACEKIDRVLSLSSLGEVNHIIYHNLVKLSTKSLKMEDEEAFLSIGSPTTASTVQTLYRSSGAGSAFDARVVVSGGGATDGQGNYEIKAGLITFNCLQRPTADNQYDYATAALRGRTAYFGTGTINTSDAREKTAPVCAEQLSAHMMGDSDALLDAWADVQLIAFQWLESIRLKGEDIARWHFGIIAQQVRDAFLAHGLDGTRYGLLCYDEWEDEFEDIIEDKINEIGEPYSESTGEKRLIVPAGNRWGIRPDQCLFLEAALQRRNYQRLLARIEALEAK